MSTTVDSDESSALFLWMSISVHAVIWCGSLAMLAWYVFRSMGVFNDFGIELSDGAMWVIVLTDWIVNFWYIVLPVVVLLVAGSDLVVFAMTRSAWLRGLWVAIGCLIPLLLTGTMFRTMHGVFQQLREELN